MTAYLELFALIAFVVIVLGTILGTAPTPTARGTPTGIPLYEGIPVKVTLSLNTTISWWEKTVKGSGLDKGPMIDISTQFNTARMTFYPRLLAKNDDVVIEAAWDPNVYNQFETICASPATAATNIVTETYPDGSTYCYYAAPYKLERVVMKPGEQPMINVTLCVTNYDPVAHVEAPPVLTSVPGT